MKGFFTTLGAVGLLMGTSLQAVTLSDLQNDAKLTPKRYAGYFSDFEYKFTPGVQPPEVFLSTKSGDCDDYAILADTVLHPKGYGTRLISIRMPGLVAHVICYVGEEKGYLDYNNRVFFSKIQRANSDLRDIANKVAKSFDANWTSASEFVYLGDGMKRMVSTLGKTDSKESAPVTREPGTQIKIDF